MILTVSRLQSKIELFMRKIFSLFVLLTLFAAGCGRSRQHDAAENQAGSGTAELAFREYEHHFGKVKEGEKVSYQFVFQNKGTGPLVLQSVSTTCGCTVPKYSVKPIAPGEEGSLEVIFDTSDRSGMQTKTITVRSNASKPVILLKITAEVE